MTGMNTIGIDGSHLFGFMAALGALRLFDASVATGASSRPTLAFDASYNAIFGGIGADEDAAVNALMGALEARRRYYTEALADVDRPGDFTPERFATAASSAQGWQLDALAGLACSVGDAIAESTLCAANGAGHQKLIQSMRDILSLAQPGHIADALFRPWSKSYEVPAEDRKSLALGDRKPTLRLDPGDERLYALRSTNPTSKTSAYRTELGAQALAIAAFEILPVCPMRRPLCIASRRGLRSVFFQWNLWSVPASLASVRSLLAAGPGNKRTSQMRGAFAGFEAARVSGEKGKLSISPTAGIWSGNSM